MTPPVRRKWPREGRRVCNLQGGGYTAVYRLSARKWEMRVFDPSGELWCMATDPTLTKAMDRARSFISKPPVWLCPHGNKLGSCTHCDVQGDLAYDAAREDRYR